MQSRVHSWPRLISENKDIPPLFVGKFHSAACHLEQFPYTIYLPRYSWNERETNELLLFVIDDQLYILEETKNGIEVTGYPFEDIVLLNRGTMLLYSWIKIVGLVNGKIKTTVIEFNTVTESMFERLLSAIRHKYGSSTAFDDAFACTGSSGLEALSNLDYKFSNYARKSILSGQRIRELLFQPVIKAKYFRFFSRMISKAHLHILTDSELIVIKEDNADVKRFKTKKYLAVWHYVPLNKIQSVSMSENNQDMPVELKVELPDGIVLSSVFDASNKKCLSDMIRHIEL